MSAPLLRMTGISKAYPGTQALSEVDFEVAPGEIVGLLGKNGAGKSTLIKILAGIVQPDAGTVEVDGVEKRGWNTHDAAAACFDFVFQELEEFPALTVGENVMLGSRLPTRAGVFVSDRALHREAARHLAEAGCPVSSRARMADLTPVQRRLVMIARALAGDNRLLVLDEPTAALTPHEVDQLLDLCRKLRAAGSSIVYVSHKLPEVLGLVDRIVVLRDGENAADRPAAEFDLDSLVASISGNAALRISDRDREPVPDDAEVVMSVRGLGDGEAFHDVSFDVRRGEVLGIGGLVGAGRTELVRTIVGDRPRREGQVVLHGREVRFRTVTQALAGGVFMLPEERRAQGLLADFDIRSNISISSLSGFRVSRWLPFVSRRRERSGVEPYVSMLQMKIPGLGYAVSTLSGGNQQKVLTARALMTESDVVIMDEPTAGVDVEAKEEVYRTVDLLRSQGRSVIVISSDFAELVRMSDRVLVLSGGQQAGTLDGDDVRADEITRLCYLHGVGTPA